MNCKKCKNGWGGSAFTPYECENCLKVYNHPNTSVPRLCRYCSSELRKCERCLNDLA